MEDIKEKLTNKITEFSNVKVGFLSIIPSHDFLDFTKFIEMNEKNRPNVKDKDGAIEFLSSTIMNEQDERLDILLETLVDSLGLGLKQHILLYITMSRLENIKKESGEDFLHLSAMTNVIMRYLANSNIDKVIRHIVDMLDNNVVILFNDLLIGNDELLKLFYSIDGINEEELNHMLIVAFIAKEKMIDLTKDRYDSLLTYLKDSEDGLRKTIELT